MNREATARVNGTRANGTAPAVVQTAANSAETSVNRFAFAIHPLDVSFIKNDPTYRWTRLLPSKVVEFFAAYLPPFVVSKVTGGQSPATGQRIEGYLITLGATPREMMRRRPEFTYRRLEAAARIAAKKNANIMGLGAFTSVVGDAGVTVNQNSPIAITSGNSLTVAATLETAKQAARDLGIMDLTSGRAMVVGATGSIGSACARLLAMAVGDVVLVSIEPERLEELKKTIEEETPGARVTTALKPDEHLPSCDVVITATSAFGQRIVNLADCKPGAIICDVARPPDISKQEAALRPDVLVIESGEVLIPGDVEIGYNIGLPPGVAYACLAETALLAMDGRFESYTLGRKIKPEQVKEIYRMYKKHGFQLAELRSFGTILTPQVYAQKRAAAERLLNDPALLAQTRREVAAKINKMPVTAKGVKAPSKRRWPQAVAGLTAVGAAAAVWLFGRNKS